MDLLCYLSFYPVALAGGAARCASTRIGYVQRINSVKSVLNELSIVHCPLLRPNEGGVKRSTERSVKKSRLSERSEFSEILA